MNRIMITVAMLAVASASASALAQERLPFPPVPSGSTAGRTIEQSMYKPRAQAQRLPKDAPNILVIMLDDVGPALPNTYGGDITSSTLTRVASAGISFNRFHNAAMCSPTRASS